MSVLDFQENVIQWYTGYKTAASSFTQKKYINRVRKLAEEYPKDVRIVAENSDGSICAKFPIKWVKIAPPRQLSDEQRVAAAERLKKYREEKDEDDE